MQEAIISYLFGSQRETRLKSSFDVSRLSKLTEIQELYCLKILWRGCDIENVHLRSNFSGSCTPDSNRPDSFLACSVEKGRSVFYSKINKGFTCKKYVWSQNLTIKRHVWIKGLLVFSRCLQVWQKCWIYFPDNIFQTQFLFPDQIVPLGKTKVHHLSSSFYYLRNSCYQSPNNNLRMDKKNRPPKNWNQNHSEWWKFTGHFLLLWIAQQLLAI